MGRSYRPGGDASRQIGHVGGVAPSLFDHHCTAHHFLSLPGLFQDAVEGTRRKVIRGFSRIVAPPGLFWMFELPVVAACRHGGANRLLRSSLSLQRTFI